jgi:general secretion pathway protein G
MAARGFTLIEIMVVVVIIGLLAAFVAPSLISNVDDAQINRARQDIRTIENALELYRLHNHRYPTNDEGLAALIGNDSQRAYLRGGVPRDPWNNPYQYRNPGQHGDYDVFSFGADGRDGGEGINAVIGNWHID